MRTRLPNLLAALAVLALQACNPAPAATGTAEDEAAIRAISDKYAAAMSAKDTAALGALVAEDYQDVNPTGAHTQGRAGFLAVAAADFASMPPGMAMTLKGGTTFVRWIDANHAVAGGTYEMSPAMPPMPAKGSWLAVVEKRDNTWKMVSALGSADLSAMMAPDTTKKP